MTFIVPLEFAEPEERPGREAAEKGARASGTPFISFFAPLEMLPLAREHGGFKCAAPLARRYNGILVAFS
jgi:hypothetical protein